MKPILLILVLVTALLPAGCSREPSRESAGRLASWPAATPEADSITDSLEMDLVLMTPRDIALERIRRLRRALPESPENSRRAEFFHIMLVQRPRMDGGSSPYLMTEPLHRALSALREKTDPEREEYLRHRIDALCSMASNSEEQIFRLVHHNLDYFRSVGDTVHLANAYTVLSFLYIEIGDIPAALEASATANNLLREKKVPESMRLVENTVKALVLSRSGRKKEAEEVLAELPPPPPEMNAVVQECYWRWVYHITGDRESLRRAYLIAMGSDSLLRPLAALDASLLAMEHAEQGQSDSALAYMQAVNGLPLTSVADSLTHAMAGAITYSAAGKLDSAYTYWRSLSPLNRRRVDHNRRLALRRMEYEREVMKEEQLDADARRGTHTLMAIGLLVAVMALIILLWSKYRQRKHRQIDLLRERLHTSQSVGEQLRGELEQLRSEKSGMSTAGGTTRTGGDAEMERFAAALRNRVPDLPDTLVRHAWCMAAGMSANDVARLLGVRPGSVHQARWRLRRKLEEAWGEGDVEERLRELYDSIRHEEG